MFNNCNFGENTTITINITQEKEKNESKLLARLKKILLWVLKKCGSFLGKFLITAILSFLAERWHSLL